MAQISAKNFDFWYMDGSLFLQNGYMDGWHFKNPSGTPLPRPKLSTPPPGFFTHFHKVCLANFSKCQLSRHMALEGTLTTCRIWKIITFLEFLSQGRRSDILLNKIQAFLIFDPLITLWGHFKAPYFKMLNDARVASVCLYVRTCQRVRNGKNIATIRDFHLPSSFFCLSTRLEPRIEYFSFKWLVVSASFHQVHVTLMVVGAPSLIAFNPVPSVTNYLLLPVSDRLTRSLLWQ